MFAFEFEDKNKKNKGIPPSAEIAEETDRVTTREIDEYIRKGKNLGNEKEEKTNK